MVHEFKLDKFNGPLDLLLSLLQEKKMEISEVAISEVTEQYLSYIDKIEEKIPEELSDFLVVASKLVLLKARSILPNFVPEEEEDGGNIEEQLRLYRAFVEVSKKLNKIWLSPNRSFYRLEPPRKSEGFVWPSNVDKEAMHGSMNKLIIRLKPLKPLPQTRIDRTVSLKERIKYIHDIIKRQKQANFFSLLNDRNNKTELVVSFLALLELMKQKTVKLEQKEVFSDIVISRV